MLSWSTLTGAKFLMWFFFRSLLWFWWWIKHIDTYFENHYRFCSLSKSLFIPDLRWNIVQYSFSLRFIWSKENLLSLPRWSGVNVIKTRDTYLRHRRAARLALTLVASFQWRRCMSFDITVFHCGTIKTMQALIKWIDKLWGINFLIPDLERFLN